MIPTITQDNLYLLLPSKMAWMADYMMQATNNDVVEAVCKVYQSELYAQLEQEHTKLWPEGPVSLYQRLSQTK